MQNCSAFNDNLLDRELFGHKRGAFTGAVTDKKGLFEVADGGTFFLDEIGDMSPALQVKLLRVLQEGTFTPVGDTEPRKVDVRIIAATQPRSAEDGRARRVPRGPLLPHQRHQHHGAAAARARDDIPLLVRALPAAKRQRAAAARPPRLADERAGARCSRIAWPGNIRELENEIERLVVLAGDDKVIGEELLSPRIRQDAPDEGAARSLPAAVDALERNLIYEVLKRTHWNKTKAAEELRISRRNLIRKVTKYKLDQRRLR